MSSTGWSQAETADLRSSNSSGTAYTSTCRATDAPLSVPLVLHDSVGTITFKINGTHTIAYGTNANILDDGRSIAHLQFSTSDQDLAVLRQLRETNPALYTAFLSAMSSRLGTLLRYRHQDDFPDVPTEHLDERLGRVRST